MPYQPGQRLPGEHASRLGHLEVLKSELVNKLCQSFEGTASTTLPPATWQTTPSSNEPLSLIFGVDGSVQHIEDDKPPYKALAFVKTALLRMDSVALAKLDKESPNPFALRDILSDAALYHATVFPLRNVVIPGLSLYDAVRQTIFESVKDASLNAEPMETLKWLAFEKWDGKKKPLPLFDCPHCSETCATLPYDAETGSCPSCKKALFLTDMLGFHQEMGPDSAPNQVATNYMSVHETLLFFTGIRYFWENKRDILPTCLFVKDGPLSIRAQYSKLVEPIRRFLAHAQANGTTIHILSQEKTGYFVDHLALIGRDAPVGSFFIPDDQYIRAEIQHRASTGDPYGRYTNYGAKIFVKLTEFHQMVINIPTGRYVANPSYNDLIGADRIFATLPTILSARYEGALLPIELANGVASLSTYPSAQILKVFADTMGH